MAHRTAVPRIGLGTFKARGTEVQEAVLAALGCGIRHIDTASIYKNEADIAEALERSGVPREQVFITSKVSPYEQGEAKARQACEGILERLGTSYVDLVLIHWPGVAKLDAKSPQNAELRRETWRVLESYHRDGKFRNIGVSNYTVHHLLELLTYATVRPAANQVELHPRWQQRELLSLCKQEGIAVVAYASLGCGELLLEPEVAWVAAQAGASLAQGLLAWALSKGCCVIPKSVRPVRIAEFAPGALLGIHLGEGAVAALDALGSQPRKYCWDPEGIL